jgi:hypothetical protein
MCAAYEEEQYTPRGMFPDLPNRVGRGHVCAMVCCLT